MMRYLRGGIIGGFSLWCVILVMLMYVNLIHSREPFCPEHIPNNHFFWVLSGSAMLAYLLLFGINTIARKNKTKQFRIITYLYLSFLLLLGLGYAVDYIL